MAAGTTLTVTGYVLRQVVGNVYVIIAVPLVIPDTTPPSRVTEATAGTLLVQLPPAVALVKVILLPTHTAEEPAIGAGNGSTVSTAVT